MHPGPVALAGAEASVGNRCGRDARAPRRKLMRRGGSRGIDFFMNIDAQDAQDERDESFLHQKPAPAMIACGFADAQDYKLAVS